MVDSFKVGWIASISSISPRNWQAMSATSNPFFSHAFLLGLEQGGSIDGTSGWQSQHLAVWQGEQLVALVPGYLKTHSYGEYLFDWQIAQAYEQLQLPYYPKWIAAIPFTPVTGPRLGMQQGTDQHAVLSAVCQFLKNEQNQGKLHSVQWLYPEAELAQALAEQGLWLRYDVQFLWHNQHYSNFAHFLAKLHSRKRKQIAKERAACNGLNLKTLSGNALTDQHWQQIISCYQATYLKRSGHRGYFTPQTFQLLAKSMAAQIVVFAAFADDDAQKIMAAALCFRGKDTLYGRYWGALEHNEFLHFELCYYQGIEYCIANGLSYFDAGAQGEHKLKRGFAPVLRYGAYYFSNTPLSSAIQRYFLQEQQHIREYIRAAEAALPYK